MAEPPRAVVADHPVERAGVLLAAALQRALSARGQARLAIPGGSAVRTLRAARERLGERWGRVLLTWVDERCVPFDDPTSNRGSAYRAGGLDAAHPLAFELPLFLDGERPEEALARVALGFADELAGGLDVVLLGMGPDGHVASLFPGRAAQAGMVAHVADSPKPPAERITLTRAALATAQDTVLLATGEPKRPALERLLAGDPELPASGLPGLLVVTDLDLGDRT